MERFTQRARRVLSLAHQEAERMRHNYIGTEHLLLGLMREDGGAAGRVLRELGLDVKTVQALIERLTGLGRIESAPARNDLFIACVDPIFTSIIIGILPKTGSLRICRTRVSP